MMSEETEEVCTACECNKWDYGRQYKLHCHCSLDIRGRLDGKEDCVNVFGVNGTVAVIIIIIIIIYMYIHVVIL